MKWLEKAFPNDVCGPFVVFIGFLELGPFAGFEFTSEEYKDGHWYQKGTYTADDGKKYVGEFRDKRFHGNGEFSDCDKKSSPEKRSGEFREGLFGTERPTTVKTVVSSLFIREVLGSHRLLHHRLRQMMVPSCWRRFSSPTI
ncbi:MAG: hypothetical protein CM1200mP41_08310 [Gammaproteobacteria bacterium]|nr:MAG: hypothetical protein CM1200mP41_08310 [Gammaproteobacteria bacterium]